MANPVIIVQARMGSSRLPGKVLMDIAGQPMLWHVVTRAQRAGIPVVVATPEGPQDERLGEYVLGQGWPLWKGCDEDNVLCRYACAATAHQADPVIRVTADCPLIDPGVIRACLRAYERGGYDYLSNNLEKRFPHGLDVEVIRAQALSDSDALASSSHDREHVTEFIRNSAPGCFKLGNLLPPSPESNYGHILVTVDTLDDLERVRSIYAAFPEGHPIGLADIIEWWEHRNAHSL